MRPRQASGLAARPERCSAALKQQPLDQIDLAEPPAPEQPGKSQLEKQRMKDDPSPFATEEESRPVVQLWMIFVSMIVFAFMSLLIMFAARVPAISNSIHDVMGMPRAAKPDRPDRSTHLFMLLFCYSSPLLLMLWVGFLRRILIRWTPNQTRTESEDFGSPFEDGKP